MLHPPFARTAALPPAVREAGADTGSRHSLQTVYRKTVQRCYTLVVGKYLQTDRPAGRSARARAEGRTIHGTAQQHQNAELRPQISAERYGQHPAVPRAAAKSRPARAGCPHSCRAARRGTRVCLLPRWIRCTAACPARSAAHPCLHRTAPRPCGERGMVRALFKPVLACDAQHVPKA